MERKREIKKQQILKYQNENMWIVAIAIIHENANLTYLSEF